MPRLALLLSLVVGLAACGGSDGSGDTTPTDAPGTTAAEGLLSLSLGSPGGPVSGPVPVTVTLTNGTDGPLLVIEPYFTPNLVRFALTGPEGSEVPFDGPFARLQPAGDERFHTLAPGETVSVTFDLAEHFMLQPGEHSLTAEYRNPPGASHEGERAITFEAGEGPVADPIAIEVTP